MPFKFNGFFDFVVLVIGHHIFDLCEAVVITEEISDWPQGSTAHLLDRLANRWDAISMHYLVKRKFSLAHIECEVSLDSTWAEFPQFGNLFNRFSLLKESKTLLAGRRVMFSLSIGHSFGVTAKRIVPR